jgi:hypothetical protein
LVYRQGPGRVEEGVFVFVEACLAVAGGAGEDVDVGAGDVAGVETFALCEQLEHLDRRREHTFTI